MILYRFLFNLYYSCYEKNKELPKRVANVIDKRLCGKSYGDIETDRKDQSESE